MSNDTDIRWIGPKPSDKFFADYMHIEDPFPVGLVESDYFSEKPLGTQEKPVYSRLKELVDCAKLLKSTHTPVNISDSRERNSYKGDQWRPDVGLLRNDDATSTMEGDTKADERSDESYVPPAEKTLRAFTHKSGIKIAISN